MVKALVLFSGTKSVEKAMAKIWPDIQTTSVDCSPEYQPDICVDIGRWNFYEDVRHGEFDIVWASPPCTQYSRARQSDRDLDTADRLAKLAFQIIDHLQPTAWFVENPATGLMHKRPDMGIYSPYRKVVSYCHYGTRYRKLTSIWTNVDVRLKVCNSNTPCNHFRELRYHPETAQKGPSRVSGGRWASGNPTSVLWHVPEPLIHELCRASGIATDIPLPVPNA